MVALRAQVDRLEQALAGIEGQGGEVAQLISRLEALESGSGAEGDQELTRRIEALAAADADLQERLNALGTGADQGEAGTQLTDLAARVDELETAIADASAGAAPGEAVTQRLSGLEGKLTDLSATLGQLQQAIPAAGAAGEQRLAEVSSRMDALETRLGQAEKAGQNVEQLTSRVGAIEQEVAASREQATSLTDEVVALSSQTGALSTRVDVLAKTVDQLQHQVASGEDRRTRAATLALIIAQLNAALDGGKSFEELLDGLRALGVDDPTATAAIERLEAAAATGAPGLPELRNEFDRIANEIVHAAQAPDGDGLLDQAAGNLMRLVTVRPVGADVEGDGAAARVARAEAALAKGDLTAAVAELEGLEGAAAEAAAPWLAQARARLAAQQALAALQDRATRLLSEVE